MTEQGKSKKLKGTHKEKEPMVTSPCLEKFCAGRPRRANFSLNLFMERNKNIYEEDA
jgi:hypothetical protein